MFNTIQDYAWGSEKYLQELTGTDQKGPLAELWMGVHPRGGSEVELPDGTRSPLSDLILSDPEKYIGSSLSRKFGNLPFLFKLLAAGDPLSIQAHPSKQQAEQGFARENASGIPLASFNRNYKDDNHKPEIICALTPYWAMKGFRDPREIRENFLPWLSPAVAETIIPSISENTQEFLRIFFNSLMTLEEQDKKSVLADALNWCEGKDSDAAHWVIALQKKYPGDIGILAPLYLNTLCLQPGEALFLPAGELHAYLQGFGVELMANSDNVLRGGLTPKFMDVNELMNTLKFSSGSPEILRPRVLPDGTSLYSTPSGEFQLVSVKLDRKVSALHLEAGYPVSILVVVSGSLTLRDHESSLYLGKGESCFIPSGAKGINLSSRNGDTEAFIARAVPE